MSGADSQGGLGLVGWVECEKAGWAGWRRVLDMLWSVAKRQLNWCGPRFGEECGVGWVMGRMEGGVEEEEGRQWVFVTCA